MSTATRLIFGLAVIGAVGSMAVVAHAGTINVQITDQEITYQGSHNGGTIFDSPDSDGGNLDPTEADIVNTVQFNLNGNAPPASGGNNVLFAGNMGGPLYGDFLLSNVGAMVPISGVMLSTIGTGGLYDLFTSPGNQPLLRLSFGPLNTLLNSGVVLITGKANVVSQNLPFGLAFDTSQQVDFAYTATGPGIVGTATDSTLFIAGGTINISGADVIPEPTSIAMLLTSLLGFGLVGVRRRQSVVA